MPLALAPDWFGGPQHLIAGFLLASAVFALGRWRGLGRVIASIVAIGVVGLAECLVEIVEYPVLYGDGFHRSAYYDTIADMADTLVGGVVGLLVAAGISGLRARRVP